MDLSIVVDRETVGRGRTATTRRLGVLMLCHPDPGVDGVSVLKLPAGQQP